MREMRFEYRDAGNNCLDGKPDEKWMNFDPEGKIGNNCLNGESSYEIPENETAGILLYLFSGGHYTHHLVN